MKIKAERQLSPLVWDAELVADQLADAPQKTPRQAWALNRPLLVMTIAILLACIVIAAYLHNRQVAVVASQLLELADQADAKEDWKQVASRLTRYLRMRSDDMKVTRRLADLYYEHAGSIEEVRAGTRLYSRCLPAYVDEEAEHVKLQLRYVTMLARIYPNLALSELDRIIPRGSELIEFLNNKPALVEAVRMRTGILEYQLTQESDKTASRERLIEDYEAIVAKDADNSRILQRLALLYRQHAEEFETIDEKMAAQFDKKADRSMDKAVEVNPNDLEVLLRRFQYRLRYSRSRHLSTDDLQRSLELDNTNPRVLLNLAFYLAGPHTEPDQTSRAALRNAREFLSSSADSLPQEAFVLVALANIHIQLQDEAAAEECLQQAAKRFPDSHIVPVAQTELALSQRRFEDAAAAIRRIREAARKTRQMAASSPEEVHLARVRAAVADVLEAELLLESGGGKTEKKKAIDLLHGIDLARLQSHDRVDVLEHIARLFARLGDWDNTIDALRRARSTGIVRLQSEFLLANCYERMGEENKAIEVYQEITSQRPPLSWAKAAWFRLGMLRLRIRQESPGSVLWSDVQAASDELSVIAPASEEAFLMRMYLELAQGITDRSAAVTELKAVASKFNRSVQYWLLCADVYRQLGELTLWQEAMDRLAEVTASVPDSRAAAAIRPIMSFRLTQDDLKHIQQFSKTWNEGTEDKLDTVRRWCEEVPDSISARLALVNLGVTLRRTEIIEEAVQSLQAIEGGSGFFWKIADVHKLLTSFAEGNAQDGAAAQRFAEELVSLYPRDPTVAQLAAVCQETCGDLRTASDHYRRAAEIDTSDRAVDGRLRTLVHLGDWERALEFIEQLPAESWLTQERLELVVHVLCEHRKFATAIQVIEQAVDKIGQHTARTRYLMAVVRMREPSRENAIHAHIEMLRAVEQWPGNLSYWIALFHVEINYHPELWTRDVCRTANRIRWLLEAHNREFAPAWSSLILAQSLQLQGRLADADAFFRKTIAVEPGTSALGWIPLASLSKNITATDSPVTPEVAWLAGDESARTLAAIQALWHGQVQTGLEFPDDDSRLHALLAVRSGDEGSAIQCLAAMAPGRLGSGDLLLLAALCDRSGAGPAARQHRMNCINQPGVSEFAIQEVLDVAMATGDFELARQCVGELGDRFPSPANRQLIDLRIELAAGPLPEDLEARIRRRQQKLTAEGDRQAFLFRVADFLAERGEVKLAGRLMDEAVGNQTNRPQVLGLWLTSHPSLLEWAIRSLPKARMEEPPAVVIQMLYRLSLHVPEQSPHRAPLIDLCTAILEESPEVTPSDWARLASAFDQLLRPELALRACEHALPEDGSPSLMEHYLIWLKGGYLRNLPTAQEDLDRLIRQFGPREDLMDTRSILFLRDAQPAEAVRITRELTLHEPRNAAYQVNHRLATAYLRSPAERKDDLLAIDQEQRREASVLARIILDELLEQKTDGSPSNAAD